MYICWHNVVIYVHVLQNVVIICQNTNNLNVNQINSKGWKQSVKSVWGKKTNAKRDS